MLSRDELEEFKRRLAILPTTTAGTTENNDHRPQRSSNS
jgi:hypothetical protein